METNYESSRMRSVFFFKDGRIRQAFFHDVETAIIFIKAMDLIGVDAQLNIWSWGVKVER